MKAFLRATRIFVAEWLFLKSIHLMPEGSKESIAIGQLVLWYIDVIHDIRPDGVTRTAR